MRTPISYLLVDCVLNTVTVTRQNRKPRRYDNVRYERLMTWAMRVNTRLLLGRGQVRPWSYGWSYIPGEPAPEQNAQGEEEIRYF